MSKRKREDDEYSSKRPRQYSRLVPLSGRSAPGTALVPLTRVGYDSVPRTRGAPVQGEMKYFDCDRTAQAITIVTTTWPAGTVKDPETTINLGSAAVAAPLCLFAPTVGSALNQRVGRQVRVFKIKVKGTIIVPVQTGQTAADAATQCRIVLCQDMQTNASQMTGDQLFQNATGASTTISTFQNPNNFGRFRVLKDKMCILQNPNTQQPGVTVYDQAGLKRSFKMNINFKKPIIVHFNATNGGTVADIVDHSFHILAGCDDTGLVPQLAYYSRVAYKE